MGPKTDLWQWIVKGGFLVHAILLYVATMAFFLPVAPIAWVIGGAEGVAAAAAGAFLCFSGGLLSLVWNLAFPGPKLLVVRILGGMLPRMGVPLMGGLVLQITVEPLAESGILIYLLVFYPALLSLETWLSLSTLDGSSQDTDNKSLPTHRTKNV
ncbi:MAG: hypothetical protein ACYC6Y_05345 [Thermoguttaceae bacterium]